MTLRLKDTVGEGKRPGKGTIGAIVAKLLRIRFDCKDPTNLKIDAGWYPIMLALSLTASDERRMIREEGEREQPNTNTDRIKGYIAERVATCETMAAVANLGSSLARARDLWWEGGDYHQYADAKESARREIEALTKILDNLPLDTRR